MVDIYCNHCEKATVCKIVDILLKFSDDIKRPLGVDLKMLHCENFVNDGDDIAEEED